MTMVSFAHVTVEDAEIIGFLKRELRIKDICQRLLSQQVIENAAQDYGIKVTAEEIQTEADNQRYQQRLESAAQTYEWLHEQLISPDDWEAGIQYQLLQKKLASHLFKNQIERYFAEHRLDFEQVLLYRIAVPYAPIAQELLYQIEESEISFYEAAHLYDSNERRRLHCGYEGKPYRWNLGPQLAASIFSAKVGDIIGPLNIDNQHHLIMVEEFISASLTPDVRQTILDRLFQEWLDSELNHLVHQHS